MLPLSPSRADGFRYAAARLLRASFAIITAITMPCHFRHDTRHYAFRRFFFFAYY